MKAFKALLKKDFQIYKKTLLIPVWITFALLLINSTLLLTAVVKTDISLITNIREVIAENADLISGENLAKASYLLGFAFALSVTLLGLLVSITASQSALNTNRNANCEGFYRSIPISDWLTNLSAYIVTIFGGWGVTFLIGTVGIIGAYIISLFFVGLNLGMVFLGFFQFFVNFMIPSLIIASIAFFFSSIFESKAFFKMILLFLVVKYALTTMDLVLGIHIPDPFKYIFKPIISSFTVLENVESVFETIELRDIVKQMWGSIFAWKTSFYLLINAGLFTGATYIKRYKDVR